MKAKIISQADHDRQTLHELIPLKTPLVLYVEPSGFCNLKCNFCPQNNSHMIKDHMKLSTWKQVINQAKKFDEKLKLLRVCGNGEPLMNLNLIDMVEYAYKIDIAEKKELVTNGTLLNKVFAEYLPHYFTRIIISIEGLSTDDYEAMTGVRANFNKLVSNIEKLYSKKQNCTIAIKIIDDAIKRSDKKELFFNTFGDICDEIFIEKLVPMWPNTDYNTDIKSRFTDEQIIKRQVCVQIFKGLQVQANGDVVACCVDWERINLLGNINNQSIKKIWEGKELKKLQLLHLEGHKKDMYPCAKCTMNDTCDPDNIDDYTKDLYKRLR